jgi:hypothetical protein
LSQFHLRDWFVPPVSVPLFLLPLAFAACMDRPAQLQYLISGNDECGRVNLGRDTAAEALKKARELLQEGYLDVRICTPRGQVLLSDEFDQIEGQ